MCRVCADSVAAERRPLPYRLTVFTPTQLEQAIRQSWSEETADPRDGERWSPGNASLGHCDVTSLVVHDLFGGDLAAADVYYPARRRS